ncbi:hypothetical protein TNCV_4669351 [Trichonephila clavipes]|nr:hypothetical protein TNCV_4669351 [Trichonephila clavipes]
MRVLIPSNNVRVERELYVNIAHTLYSNKRTIEDAPGDFEPRSNYQDDTRASNLNDLYHTTPTGGHVSLDRFTAHQPTLHKESSVASGLEHATSS